MKYPAVCLAIYETLYALNRDIDQVVAHLARLQELGIRRAPAGVVRSVLALHRDNDVDHSLVAGDAARDLADAEHEEGGQGEEAGEGSALCK